MQEEYKYLVPAINTTPMILSLYPQIIVNRFVRIALSVKTGHSVKLYIASCIVMAKSACIVCCNISLSMQLVSIDEAGL